MLVRLFKGACVLYVCLHCYYSMMIAMCMYQCVGSMHQTKLDFTHWRHTGRVRLMASTSAAEGEAARAALLSGRSPTQAITEVRAAAAAAAAAVAANSRPGTPQSGKSARAGTLAERTAANRS